MPYIIYNKQHGPSAYVAGALNTATLRENEIAIPCEEGADVNDTARWMAEAAQITDVGAAITKALAALREKRKAVEYGGFLFNGQRWDSEQKDELRLNSAIKMFEMTGMEAFPGWKIAEATYVTATLHLLQGAALSLMQHYAAAFAVETAKETEIKALKTAKAVETWLKNSLNAGWPGQETPQGDGA